MRLFRLVILTTLIASTSLGCTSIRNSFSGGTSDINDTYFTEFIDVPVPRDMEVDTGSVDVSDNMGQKYGHIRFTGPVDALSLQDAMTYNMYKQGWSPLGIYKAKTGIMIFEKAQKVCFIQVSDSFPSNIMHIWVTAKMNGFLVPPSMPVSPKPVEPIEGQASGTGGGTSGGYSAPPNSSGGSSSGSSGSSGGGSSGTSLNEQGLSEQYLMGRVAAF